MFCIWGYVTPESFLPLASVFCAAVGGLLLLWNRLQTAVSLLWRRQRSKRDLSVRRHGAEA